MGIRGLEGGLRFMYDFIVWISASVIFCWGWGWWVVIFMGVVRLDVVLDIKVQWHLT